MFKQNRSAQKNNEDFLSAYQSDHGKKVAADSMSKVSKRTRLFVSEHFIVE